MKYIIVAMILRFVKTIAILGWILVSFERYIQRNNEKMKTLIGQKLRKIDSI